MADAVYKIKFTMSDGSVKEIQFTAPQGPQGPKGGPLLYVWRYSLYTSTLNFIEQIMELYKYSNLFLKIKYISPTNTPLNIGTPSNRKSLDSGGEVIMRVNSENVILIQTIRNDGLASPEVITANKTNLVFGYSGSASVEISCNRDLSTLYQG